jgi:general stress protein 26
MDADLRHALGVLHTPGGWVHLATIGKEGWPHVTPMLMGVRDDGQILFSLTGKQKKRNLERDNRACVELSRPGDTAHAIMWGRMVIRHDPEAQDLWNWLMTDQFGPGGLDSRRRVLSLDGTSLGVFTPEHWRLYGIPPRA